MDQQRTVVYERDINYPFGWQLGDVGEVIDCLVASEPVGSTLRKHFVTKVLKDPMHAKVKKDVRYWISRSCSSGRMTGIRQTIDDKVRVGEHVFKDGLHVA